MYDASIHPPSLARLTPSGADRLARIVSSICLLLLFAGCSDASASRADAVEGASPPEEVAETGEESGGCRFLSEAEAEKILGYPVELTTGSDAGLPARCEFEPVGGERYHSGDLILGVLEPMDPETDFVETRRELAGDVEDVADLGDQAFLYAGELWVLAGAHQVVVRVDWYGEQSAKVREADIAIAKKVLARL